MSINHPRFSKTPRLGKWDTLEKTWFLNWFSNSFIHVIRCTQMTEAKKKPRSIKRQGYFILIVPNQQPIRFKGADFAHATANSVKGRLSG
jgi:hypothetical protein